MPLTAISRPCPRNRCARREAVACSPHAALQPARGLLATLAQHRSSRWLPPGSVRRRRQDRGKRRALAEFRADDQLAAMPVENVFDDGEAKPGAALLPTGGDADPIEALGQPRQMLRRDAGAVVGHRQHEAGTASEPLRLVRDLDPDAAAGLTVLQGVLNEVLQDLYDLVAIAVDHRRRRQFLELDAGAGTGGDRLQGLDDVACG